MSRIENQPPKNFTAGSVLEAARGMQNADKDGWEYHAVPVKGEPNFYHIKVYDELGEYVATVSGWDTLGQTLGK